MTGSIDGGLGFYRQVLALRGYRQEILSADIANASTPGFKAVDLDFREALAAATGGPASPAASGVLQSGVLQSGVRLLVGDARHMSPSDAGPGDAAASVKYRADAQVSLDGNSVDLDREKLAAATNAVDYQAAATFTSQTIRMLTVAINGSAPQSSGGG